MRNVSRVPSPSSLLLYSKKWTQSLLAAIKRAKKQKEPVPDKYYNKYQKEDIRNALGEMYQDLCCYCEARIPPASFEQIEHRKPKRRFPKETYKWSNLHLVCTQCNVAKQAKWNSQYPILDPAVDTIDRHLSYSPPNYVGLVRIRISNSERGKTTIEHADLNRPRLCHLRSVIFGAVHTTLRELVTTKGAKPGSSEVSMLEDEIRAKCKGEYGSVVAWAIGYISGDSMRAT